MSLIGSSLVIVGEVRASADLTVDGRIEGPILCEGHTVTIPVSATVIGDVIARDITVFGRVQGQLIATEVVDLRGGSTSSGAVIAPSLILHEEARFNGHVEPRRLDAALSVARFQRKQRDAQAG